MSEPFNLERYAIALTREVVRLRMLEQKPRDEQVMEGLRIKGEGLEHIIASQLKRIWALEAAGDLMADELASIAGTDVVCGLCHVYSSHHKGNCSLPDVDAWRALRGQP